MIIIYKELVKKYINYITPENIISYARTQNVNLTPQESIIIHNFIKTYYCDLLDKNKDVFYYLKTKINPNIYNKILELYDEYSKKYL